MVKISIITINYNNKSGLERTIKSVINQITKDFEYIVIDGGSTDGSIEIINKYNNYITHWISEKDNGIYNAMNKGIALAQGEYCNFLNSGDFYTSQTLNIVLKELKNKDIYVGNANCFSPNKNNTIIWYAPQEITLANLFPKSLNHQAAFIKRSLMNKLLYNEKYSIIADWDFFIRALITHNCTYQHINKIVVNYERGGFSTKNIIKYKKEREDMFSNILPRRIYSDYEKIYFKPDKYIKYITYNQQYKLLRYCTMITAYCLGIPIRLYNHIKSFNK